MDNHEIVKRLVGEINPIGETNEDNRRFKNLQDMCELVNKLITDIDQVGYNYKDRAEFSMRRASNFASRFLTEEVGIAE